VIFFNEYIKEKIINMKPDMKPVLIIERCMDGLKPLTESVKKDDPFILTGVFTEFNIKNRNDRVYTAEKFLPHLDEMLSRKNKLGVVYGEFDHPDVFDTSLARVSHTIENATYFKEENLVRGDIRLLSTQWGKEAKALVNDGCPIFVSSRAAGVTESDGTVTVKKLFTYDAVADPGFSSARMEVKSLNESLGFNESANFRIYDMSDESKINELFTMNNNEDLVTKKQMIEYSNYLTEEIEKFKGSINEAITTKSEYDPEKLEKMLAYYEKLHEQQTKIAKYLDYLAEKLQFVVNENVELKKTTTKLIEHNRYLAESIETVANYSEYLAENLDKSIDYGKYIAETLDKNIDFSEYIAEHVDKNIKYSEYLAENLDKSIDYQEYIAENLDKSIDYQEYLAENLDNSIVYSEYIAENLDNSIVYSEYIAEHVDNNISYSEYIAENLDDSMAYSNYIAESLDRTIEKSKLLTEQLKDGKILENFDFITEEEGKPENVGGYYEAPSTPTVDQTVTAEVGEETGEETGEEVGAEAGEEVGAEAGEELAELPTETPEGEELDDEAGLEGEEGVATELTPGETVAVGDQTGEVLATNPQTGIVVVQLDTQEEPIQVQESQVTRLGSKLNEIQNSLKQNLNTLILETKKRKASENDQPNFLLFLTEKRKQAYFALSNEDKTKVKFALKESEGKYTSEAQVLAIMNEALSPKKKTFNELLLDAMPSDLKPIWEKLDTNIQNNIISTSRLFPSLDSIQKFESFWYSRDLARYTNEKPAKTLITENHIVDNSKLTESQLDVFKSVFNKLNS
jgi:hypothetical protein